MFPFNPQPLTDHQKEQIRDNAKADSLAVKVRSEMLIASAEFGMANAHRIQHMMENPYQPDDANVKEFDRLKVLSQNLELYYAAVIPGWKGGIGQPNHETYDALIARLKSVWPDAAAMVNP